MPRRPMRLDDIEAGSEEDYLITSLAPGYLRPEHLREGLDVDDDDILEATYNGELKFKLVCGIPVFLPGDVIKWAAKRSGY